MEKQNVICSALLIEALSKRRWDRRIQISTSRIRLPCFALSSTETREKVDEAMTTCSTSSQSHPSSSAVQIRDFRAVE